MKSIRITNRPSGQAPDWVREQWVGVVIPLASQEVKGIQLGTDGGLPDPRNINGYHVSTAEAINAVEAKSPEAANWWRKNLPLAHCPQLVFGREFCEVVE